MELFFVIQFFVRLYLLSTGLAPVEAAIASYHQSDFANPYWVAAAASDRLSYGQNFSRAALNSGLSKPSDGEIPKAARINVFDWDIAFARREKGEGGREIW